MSEPNTTPDGAPIDETLPPLVQAFLRQGGKLETILLRDDGEWRHEGCRFENPKIIKLFSRSVARTPGGTWILQIGRFTYPITVEGCGYFVERVRWPDGDDALPELTLSDETTEALDPTSLQYEPGGRLTCAIKGGEHRARFKKTAYYALAERVVVDDDDALVLPVGGLRVPLGGLDDEG